MCSSGFKSNIYKYILRKNGTRSPNFPIRDPSHRTFLTRSRVSPAGDGDFYFGSGDVPGDRVEVVHRWHVLQLVHNISLHHLHGQVRRWRGSDPGSAQPGSDRARWVSGDSGDQIRDQVASGATGWGSHLTNVEAGQNGEGVKGRTDGRQRRGDALG